MLLLQIFQSVSYARSEKVQRIEMHWFITVQMQPA